MCHLDRTRIPFIISKLPRDYAQKKFERKCNVIKLRLTQTDFFFVIVIVFNIFEINQLDVYVIRIIVKQSRNNHMLIISTLYYTT